MILRFIIDRTRQNQLTIIRKRKRRRTRTKTKNLHQSNYPLFPIFTITFIFLLIYTSSSETEAATASQSGPTGNLKPITLPIYRRSNSDHQNHKFPFQRLKLIHKYNSINLVNLPDSHSDTKLLQPRQISVPLPAIPDPQSDPTLKNNINSNTPTSTSTSTPPPSSSSNSTPYRGVSDGNGGVIGLQKILNFQADLEYFASVAIGTPPQLLNVILDTGSSDLWIASANCTVSTGCSNGLGPKFDPSTSSTATTSNNAFNIKYGSGSATGKMFTDNMTFAGYKLPPQSFAVVDKVTSELLSKDVSGLMGLGFQPLASSGVMPIWQAIVNNDSPNSNVTFPGFSFALTRFINVSRPAEVEPGGIFTLGTLNASLIAPGESINFIGVPQGLQSYWLIPMDGLQVNGFSLDLSSQTSPNVAIDTGTTLIGGPANEVKQFYSQVIGSSPASGSYQGYYSYPCNTSVNVNFTFGGRNYSMTPDDFNLGPFGSNGRCLGSVFELELTGASKSLISWVVGDSFLKNVLSVYRYVPPAVGFARLSNVFNMTAPTPIATNGVLFSPSELNVTEYNGSSKDRPNNGTNLNGLNLNGINGSLALGANGPKSSQKSNSPSILLPRPHLIASASLLPLLLASLSL